MSSNIIFVRFSDTCLIDDDAAPSFHCTECYMLATHFNLEVVIVSLEGMMLKYNSEGPGLKGKGYLLYTGQHYDALVGADSEETAVEDEIRIFTDAEGVDKKSLEAAKIAKAERDFRATQRVVKKLKCSGCGAILDDNDAFQAHCGEVEHDDDFSFMCDEVEIVESMEDDDDAAKINLESDDVVSFYNGPQNAFSNFYPGDLLGRSKPFFVELDGKLFPTVEHFWQYSKVVTVDAAVAEKILNAETIEKAHLAGAFAPEIRKDWDDVKAGILHAAIKAKFVQHPDLREQLVATAGKTLVNIDSDKWAGLMETDGIQKGENNVGKILMNVRDELIAESSTVP